MTPSEELLKRLDQLPERQREAVATRFLSELNAQQRDTEPAQGDRSHPLPGARRVPFERIAHLAGALEGPGDLATNPAHMDDFGKSSMQ